MLTPKKLTLTSRNNAMKEMKLKDSGIPWIGQIPDYWEVKSFKEFFSTSKGLSITKADLTENGVPVINYGQVHSKLNKGNGISEKIIKHIPESFLDTDKSALVFKGDFIFADTSEDIDGCGNCCYIDIDSQIFAGYHSIIARNKQYPSKYLAYLFLTKSWRSQIHANVNGIKVFSIPQTLLKDLKILVPPIDEQERIAAWLDDKCGEIDELVEVEQQMISDLEAYRQAIITEAVTHGLNQQCQMVESGCDWYSYHPSHWKTEKIRNLFAKRSEKNNPIKTKERLSLSIDKGITLYADKTTNLDRFKDDFTQYQLAHPDDIVLNSMNMIVGAVGKSFYYGCVSPVYYVIYGKSSNVDMDYYGYLLNIPSIREVYHRLGQGIYAIERGDGRVNTCRLKVDYYEFSQISIPYPPIEEQVQIAAYLKEKENKIDNLIKIKQEKIETLKQYRQSLIFEAVTGKTTI